MNSIELYKELPKTNCGQCGERTCIAFALSAVKGSKHLKLCPFLQEDKLQRLSNSLIKLDITGNILETLREEIVKLNIELNIEGIADAIGARIVDNGIEVRCLGNDFIIEKNGEIKASGPVNIWINILLLVYIKMGAAFTGSANGWKPATWISFDRLKSGSVKDDAFKKECEIPLTVMFGQDYVRTVNSLRYLCAEPFPGQPSDDAWIIHILPKIPVLILHWRGDEEFPPAVKVLFPDNTDKFMDIESLIFLLRETVIVLQEQFAS